MKKWILQSLGLGCFFFASAQASMSNTSLLPIEGRAPELSEAGKAKKAQLGFTVTGVVYNDETSEVGISPGLTYADFSAAVPVFTAADILDADNDRYLSITYDTPTLRWLDSTGKLITHPTTAMLGCNGPTPQPHFLEVTLPNIQAATQYGDPRIGAKTEWSKRFTLNLSDGVCYIRPNSFIIEPTDPHPVESYYDATQYVPNKGFKVSAGFPTTGFKGAEFKVVMADTDDQYDWQYPGFLVPVVTTEQGNGQVLQATGNTYSPTVKNISFRFKDVKPGNGTNTITATSKATGQKYAYSFTFKPGRFWFVPKRFDGELPEVGSSKNWNVALNACGEAGMPQRKDLTNSRYNAIPESIGDTNSMWPPNQDWRYTLNYYIRAVGSVSSEWGSIVGIDLTGKKRQGNYQNSDWSPWYYWTKELYMRHDSHFMVRAGNGYVSNNPDTRKGVYVVCVE